MSTCLSKIVEDRFESKVGDGLITAKMCWAENDVSKY